MQHTAIISLHRGKIPQTCVRNLKINRSDSEVSSNAGAFGMQSTYSLLSIPGPLLTEVVAPDRFLSMCQI